MAKGITRIRGMHDITPQQTPQWQQLEQRLRTLMQAYGYDEIRMPIVEKTDLFCRSIGEVTDIVEKEMYTFPDRNGDLLTLRPEGTASCVRAGIEQGLLHNQVQRLWYQGPMFRHERPQKGRYRQFHQFGVECYGLAGADSDAELILMSARLWSELGIADAVQLELNSLGNHASRLAYRDQLVAYLSDYRHELDEDSLRRLEGNPLRILDSKNPQTQALLQNAPKLSETLDQASQDHMALLCDILNQQGLKYHLNERLVRGLDYYCLTVFEWVTDRLGAQGTVCAGGRYDGLVQQLGGRSTPAVGFAMGLERLLSLMEEMETLPKAQAPHLYLTLMGTEAQRQGLVLAERLRDALPKLRLLSHCGGGSVKSQFKKADKSGAEYALVLGDSELEQGVIGLKPLRDKSEQHRFSETQLLGELKMRFGW
ncbi:MAG: histidine--tRNA ligase [Gammaproteobacteria bacterium]|nr:histidine--tRNA ligase [Gammaproteobacteria bacterium]